MVSWRAIQRCKKTAINRCDSHLQKCLRGPSFKAAQKRPFLLPCRFAAPFTSARCYGGPIPYRHQDDCAWGSEVRPPCFVCFCGYAERASGLRFLAQEPCNLWGHRVALPVPDRAPGIAPRRGAFGKARATDCFPHYREGWPPPLCLSGASFRRRSLLEGTA